MPFTKDNAAKAGRKGGLKAWARHGSELIDRQREGRLRRIEEDLDPGDRLDPVERRRRAERVLRLQLIEAAEKRWSP